MNGCLAVGWGECHDECKDEPRQRMKILTVLLQSDSGTAKSNRTALFLLSCYVSLYSEFVAAITTPAIIFLVFMFSLSASNRFHQNRSSVVTGLILVSTVTIVAAATGVWKLHL